MIMQVKAVRSGTASTCLLSCDLVKSQEGTVGAHTISIVGNVIVFVWAKAAVVSLVIHNRQWHCIHSGGTV